MGDMAYRKKRGGPEKTRKGLTFTLRALTQIRHFGQLLFVPPIFLWYAISPMMTLSFPTAYLPVSLPRSLNLVNPTFLGGWPGPLSLPLPMLLAAFSVAIFSPLAFSFPFIMNLVSFYLWFSMALPLTSPTLFLSSPTSPPDG